MRREKLRIVEQRIMDYYALGMSTVGVGVYDFQTLQKSVRESEGTVQGRVREGGRVLAGASETASSPCTLR